MFTCSVGCSTAYMIYVIFDVIIMMSGEILLPIGSFFLEVGKIPVF